MTVIKHYCDKCGEQITDGDRTHLVMKTGPQRHQRPTVDLCGECAPLVWALIDHRPEDVTAPSPRARVARDVSPRASSAPAAAPNGAA